MAIDMNGQPEILTFCVAPSETKSTWKQMFDELKQHGLKSTKILFSDGFIGIEDIMNKYLGSQCVYQRCCIHIERNLRSYVRVNEQNEITNDFKHTLHLSTKEDAYKAYEYDAFLTKWSEKYPGLTSWAKRTPKKLFIIFIIFHLSLEHICLQIIELKV